MTTERRTAGRHARVWATCLLALSLTACAATTAAGETDAQTSAAASGSTSPTPSPLAPVAAFDPAAVSRLFLPTATGSATTGALPLIVLVPGGGWVSHDNGGLVPLAEKLAAAGFAVVNTSYRAGQEGVQFPVPIHDVQCSIAYAARTAAAQGIHGGPVIVVGHSAGGHLGALAAVSGDALHPVCADPMPAITGFVGLGGIYDTATFEPFLTGFFGVPRSGNLALWASGDPIAYVAAGTAPKRLQVLLLTGGNDNVVPSTQAGSFEAALLRAGVPVTLATVTDVGHLDLITPAVAATPIISWVTTLAR